MTSPSGGIVWNAFKISIRNTATAHTLHVTKKGDAVPAFIITEETENCLHASSRRKSKEPMTVQ